MKKIGNVFIDIMIFFILIISIIVLAMSFTSKNDGISSIAGYKFFSIQTDSMEPTIEVGDLLIEKKGNQDNEYNIGDVVTFRSYYQNQLFFNTHRIVDKKEINGIMYYYTKGDNANGYDKDALVAGDIVALWTGIRLKKVGYLFDYLQSQKGFFICILLPMIVLFLYSLFRFIQNLLQYNKQNILQEQKEMIEKQKQQIIQDYLLEQKKEEENGRSNLLY